MFLKCKNGGRAATLPLFSVCRISLSDYALRKIVWSKCRWVVDIWKTLIYKCNLYYVTWNCVTYLGRQFWRAGLVQAVESYRLWPEDPGFESRSPRIAQARVRLATDTLLQTPHRAGALYTGYAPLSGQTIWWWWMLLFIAPDGEEAWPRWEHKHLTRQFFCLFIKEKIF